MWGRCAYLPLAGVVAATVLAVAGCGGDDSAPITPVQGATGATGAGGAQSLTKSQFIEQADAVCNEANAALSSLDSSTVSSDAKLQATQELQIVRGELDSLQSLPAPTQDGSTLQSFLSALEDEVKALMDKRDAAEQGGDTSSADAEAASAESSAQAAARDYGLKDCAKGGTGEPVTGDGGVTATTVPTPTTTPTTSTPVPAAPATPAPAPPSGGTGGGGTGGGAGGGTGGGTGGSTGGTGGSGGVSP